MTVLMKVEMKTLDIILWLLSPWILSLMTCDFESGCVYTEISCDDYDDCKTDFPGSYHVPVICDV